jgi:hypothetical protein
MKRQFLPVSPSDARSVVEKMHRRTRGKNFKLVRLGEVLHLERTRPDVIDVQRADTYLKLSREQRDEITRELFGSVSRSNREWDDIIVPRRNAAPVLATLTRENHRVRAQVEAFIYSLIGADIAAVGNLIDWCETVEPGRFSIADLLSRCRGDDRLRRQMPTLFELVTFAVCATVVEALRIDVALTVSPGRSRSLKSEPAFRALFGHLLQDQAGRVRRGRLERVSVANAADGGLDIVSNFGLNVQVKHGTLDAKLAQTIARATAVEDLVVVCRSIAPTFCDCRQTDTRVRGVVTEDDLVRLASRTVGGELGREAEPALRQRIVAELRREFPGVAPDRFDRFFKERGYHNVPKWIVAA